MDCDVLDVECDWEMAVVEGLDGEVEVVEEDWFIGIGIWAVGVGCGVRLGGGVLVLVFGVWVGLGGAVVVVVAVVVEVGEGERVSDERVFGALVSQRCYQGRDCSLSDISRAVRRERILHSSGKGGRTLGVAWLWGLWRVRITSWWGCEGHVTGAGKRWRCDFSVDPRLNLSGRPRSKMVGWCNLEL